MPDLPFGLGAIESPPDENDWPIDALFAMAGLVPDASPPPSYTAPGPYPPVLNQHDTPMCVAYSTSLLKAYQDLRDTGAADLDEPRFFHNIGGTSIGAVLRYALDELLTKGYPQVGGVHPEKHRIKAYYSIPVTREAIQAAILAFGPIVLSTRWAWSWFEPTSTGVLPSPNADAGGHAIVAIGWDSRGLRLRNSWGKNYGLNGDVFLRWSYLNRVREAWKAIDQKLDLPKPPPAATFAIRIAEGTTKLQLARIDNDCITSWSPRAWGGSASSAPCHAPVIMRGCSNGQATIAQVTAGILAGKWVRITSGVTIVRT